VQILDIYNIEKKFLNIKNLIFSIFSKISQYFPTLKKSKETTKRETTTYLKTDPKIFAQSS